MENKYPDATKTGLGLNTGQVSRFVCDFNVGDWVISYNQRKIVVDLLNSLYDENIFLAKQRNHLREENDMLKQQLKTKVIVNKQYEELQRLKKENEQLKRQLIECQKQKAEYNPVKQIRTMI